MSEPSRKPDSTVYPVLSCHSIVHNQTLQAENQQLKELLSSLENQVSQMNESYCFLQAEYQQLKELLSFLENQLSQVNESYYFLQDEYQQLEQKYDRVFEENLELKCAAVEDCSGDVKSLEDCRQSNSDE